VKTVTEAAEILGVSRSRVKQFISRRRLRARRHRLGFWEIDAAELRRFSRLDRRNGRPAKNLAESN